MVDICDLLESLEHKLGSYPQLENLVVNLIVFMMPIYYRITRLIGIPPTMEVYCDNSYTTDIMRAAMFGEVTAEAVDFIIAWNGAKGVEILEIAAEAARCEHMANNTQTIMMGILRAEVPFSSEIAMVVLYDYSDIFEKGNSKEEKLQEYLETVLVAPGLSPQEKSKCAKDMLNGDGWGSEVQNELSVGQRDFLKNYICE